MKRAKRGQVRKSSPEARSESARSRSGKIGDLILNSLPSKESQRGYRHAIDEFISLVLLPTQACRSTRPLSLRRLLLQIAIAKTRRGGRQTPPYAFTGHGVAMLSSVLNSDRAVQMNILIIRTFVKLRV